MPLQNTRASPRRSVLFFKFLQTFSLYFSIYFSFLCVFFSLAPLTSLNLLDTLKSLLEMGRFAHLVDSDEGLESFKARYRIPSRVRIRYYEEGQWHEDRQEGEVAIPMIAFIK